MIKLQRDVEEFVFLVERFKALVNDPTIPGRNSLLEDLEREIETYTEVIEIARTTNAGDRDVP